MEPCDLLVIGVIKHFFLYLLIVGCQGNDNAKRLYDDLLRSSGYNKLIRPVGNNSDKLVVRLGIRLSQLIDIVSSFIFIIVLILSTPPSI